MRVFRPIEAARNQSTLYQHRRLRIKTVSVSWTESALFAVTVMVDEVAAGIAAWFALRVRRNHERIVADCLAIKKVETFCPTIQECRRFKLTTRIRQAPLFPGYLFGKFVAADRTVLFQTRGLIEILGHGTPTPVPDQQIDSIRRMLDSKLFCTPYPFLVEGSHVRVRCGPLAGSEGVLLRQNRRDFFAVLMPLLGRSVAVEIDGGNLVNCC